MHKLKIFLRGCLDPGYGLHLPDRVSAQGLRIVDVDSRLHLAPGRSPMARLMGASTAALAERYIATGQTTRADIDKYIRDTDDEHNWTVYYTTVSVIATK